MMFRKYSSNAENEMGHEQFVGLILPYLQSRSGTVADPYRRVLDCQYLSA